MLLSFSSFNFFILDCFLSNCFVFILYLLATFDSFIDASGGPRISQKGATTQHIILTFFPRKLHEIGKDWTERRMCVPSTPLDLPMDHAVKMSFYE